MESLRIGTLDIVIVLGYFVLTVMFGLWMGRRKVKSGEDLFLADRSASWPMIGASLFSANISSQQFVGQAGLAYTIGIAAGAFQMVGAMCFVFLAVFFVEVYLGLRLRTAPEFFERRYNSSSRLFVAAINIVMILAANIVTALYAGATVINDLLGWTSAFHFNIAVVAIAVAAGLYTVLGGLRSILWVDLMQATLLVLGGAMTLVLAVQAAGGVGAVLALPEGATENPWSIIKPWTHAFGWLPLITGATILGVHGHCTDHDYVQRALAAKSLFHSKMGAIFAGFLKVLALFIIAAPGVVAAKLIPGLAHPDQAYTRLITEYVPTGFVGLVMAGLLAAILGTVAAGLSASSAMLVFDFVGKWRPKMTEDRKVRLGRIVMVTILVVCTLLAPSIKSFQGVFGYLVRIWSLLAPPVFICVVFGIFSSRATSRGAVATLTTGAILGAFAFWMLGRPDILDTLPVYFRSSLNLGVVITVVCAVVMWFLRSAEAVPEAAAIRATSHTDDPGMTAGEQRLYRVSLTALLILILAVVWLLSPWGVAAL
ncbi:sodium/solute symporter [Opitutaceae bacterium]|nr:sodium/solute symporter [Opitutaceae bacterium]MDB4474134.1 sodium/solute symporter [Opitutaceae bacterium]